MSTWGSSRVGPRYDHELIRLLRAKGWSYGEIARHLDVDKANAARICDRRYAARHANKQAMYRQERKAAKSK